jgi:hypothetical protein
MLWSLFVLFLRYFDKFDVMWILRTFRGSNLLLLEEKFPSVSEREFDLIDAIFFQTSEKICPFLVVFSTLPSR